ncbi:glutathione S-transferase family protein [Brevundimonas sp.]|uniref:glutathione S-transferase family protein n=1 Tax=Brevundimonas sp. TaxID=1871086 RepID=UPI002FC59D07
MLRLAGRPTSINVRKVVWTLGELGEPFELFDPSLDPNGAQDLMSLNPIGLSPVLQDGERLLWESNTICRYLAGKFDRTDLLPANPGDRSEVEKWMDWQATNLNSAWVACFMALVRRDPAFVADPGAVQHSQKRWNALNLVLDAHLANTQYLALDRFTLADIVIGLSIHRWRDTPMLRPPTPHLDRYFTRLRERAPMLAALGRGEP